MNRTHWISLAFAAVAAAGGAYLHRGPDGDTRSIISVDQFNLHTDLLVADPDVGRHAGRIAQLVGGFPCEQAGDGRAPRSIGQLVMGRCEHDPKG
jgi:hypothetical protein